MVTAVNVAESIVRAELGGREPAGPGTATRAAAAMSAANATMSLVRTMPLQPTRPCQIRTVPWNTAGVRVQGEGV